MRDSTKSLVVDDNATNRLLAKTLLRKLGWQCDEAESGERALVMLREHTYPLVLLDISMPGMSGEEACLLMRKMPEGQGIRIIAYTAHAYPEERTRILAAGFDDLVSKPVSLQRLTEAIGSPEQGLEPTTGV